MGINLTSGMHTIEMSYTPRGLLIGAAITAVAVVVLILIVLISALSKKKSKAPKAPKPAKQRKESADSEDNEAPKGLEVMMAEDLGTDATVEQAEALLEPEDKYEGQLEKNAEGLSKADELLNTQKLDLTAILGEAESTESEE